MLSGRLFLAMDDPTPLLSPAVATVKPTHTQPDTASLASPVSNSQSSSEGTTFSSKAWTQVPAVVVGGQHVAPNSAAQLPARSSDASVGNHVVSLSNTVRI